MVGFVIRLGGRFTVVGGHSTGCHIGIRLQRVIAVLPRHRVQRRPLGVEDGIRRHGIAGEVPCIGAGGFLVPAAEGVAFRGGIGGGSRRLLAGFNGLGVRRGAVALDVEGDGVGVGEVVVAGAGRNGRAVVEVDAAGCRAEDLRRLCGAVGLAARVVRLKDSVRAGGAHTLEVAAGDDRCVALRRVVVLVGVGRRLGRGVDAAGDAGDLGVRLVINRVVARRGAVGVDLRALADLADRGCLARRSVAVPDAVAVGVDVHILDRSDHRAGVIGIGVGRRTCCSVPRRRCRLSVRSGCGAGVECVAVVIDRRSLGAGAGDRRQRTLAAVDRGDDAVVGDDGSCSGDGVALADQVDHRLVVIIGNNLAFAIHAEIDFIGCPSVGNHRDPVIQIDAVFADSRLAVKYRY